MALAGALTLKCVAVAPLTVTAALPVIDEFRGFHAFRAAIIAYLKESNSQIEPLYKLDKAHPFDANTFGSFRLTLGGMRGARRLAALGFERVASFFTPGRSQRE